VAARLGVIAPPYWTAADDAELMVLVQELVDGIYEHNERCSICSRGEAWCAHVREAFDVVLDWIERRRAASFAPVMRMVQNELNRRADAA
jgi:hypothetical protein